MCVYTIVDGFLPVNVLAAGGFEGRNDFTWDGSSSSDGHFTQ